MQGGNLLHFLKYKIGIDHPETQTSKAEQELIKKYAAISTNAAEIGVFDGFNTRIIASGLKNNGYLYAIDPFFKGKLGFSYNKLISQNYIQKNGLKNVKWIEGLSWDVISSIPGNIDLIFIDGDHSFDGVKKDFELYAGKLSDNGVLAFHDARIFENSWTKPDWGPVRLMQEVIIPSQDWKILDQVDSLVIISKK